MVDKDYLVANQQTDWKWSSGQAGDKAEVFCIKQVTNQCQERESYNSDLSDNGFLERWGPGVKITRVISVRMLTCRREELIIVKWSAMQSKSVITYKIVFYRFDFGQKLSYNR